VPTGSAIDTSLGTHAFAVTATDVAGNQTDASTSYTVVVPPDTTPPTVIVSSPATGSVFTVGGLVLANYSCSDEAGGSGLATCIGPVASGAPIDTSLGTHTFSVTATDVAGNETVVTSSYAVLGGLSGQLKPAPFLNVATAGSSLTVSFDLGSASVAGIAIPKPRPHPAKPGGSGSEVMAGLFAAGFPLTQQVDCGDPSLAIGPAQTPDIDAHVNKDGGFHLWWKTDGRWAGTCRALVLRFDVPGWRDASITYFVRFR
jgi:hypothetical protein